MSGESGSGVTKHGKQLFIAEEIYKERDRQDAKWGEQNHAQNEYMFCRLMELPHETAVAGAKFHRSNWARQRCERNAKDGSITWEDIIYEEFCEAAAEVDPAKIRVELIQLAACVLAAIESLDRNGR